MTEKDGHQSCPYCAEPIIVGALKCKHCYSMLEVKHALPIEEIVIDAGELKDNKFIDSEQPANSMSITPAAKERIAAMDKHKGTFILLMSLSYFLCAIFIGMGFYKMFAYNNPEIVMYSNPPVNVYVGGDAYNYIINANYAIAYFALSIFWAVIGMTFVLCYFYYTNEIKKEQSQIE